MTDPGRRARRPDGDHACSAIVLAGGRSARFGRDKLGEPIDGRALLDHAIDAAAGVSGDVVVVVAPGADLVVSLRPGLRVAQDPEPYGGPLVGILAGLEAAREPIAIVVGGDMPGLRPNVLALLLNRLVANEAADAVVLDDDGRLRPLPMAIRVGAATPAASAALDRGARSVHALLDGLRVDVVPASEWRTIDPTGTTLRDIDHPDDLRSAGDRGQS